MDTADDAGNSTEPAEHILQELRALQSPNDAIASEPQQPQSEREILLSSLRATPTDPEGWNKLVRLAEDSGDITRIKEAYDGLLLVYPNTVAAQIAYVNHFINPGQYQFAEELFKRFLLSSPHVDLWRVYLSYVRRINSSAQARENVRKAFEFALNHIGHDKEAGDIWVDYIRFIQQGETPTTRDEQTKMDQLRKVYQRAVQIPLENVEQLWQEYERFENGLNHVLAKKFMAEYSPAYMQARSVLRQLQKHLGAIFPKNPSPSLPIWLPNRPKFDAADRALVGAWKGYLRWEESNPLELEDKDKSILLARIRGVYRKALVRMRYFSEIWYMAYIWTASAGTQAQALKLLKDGIAANPTSFVLNFAYAEALELEGAGSFSAVHELYTTFLATLRADLEQREEALANTSGELSGSQDNEMPDASQASLRMPNGFNAHAADEKNPARKDFAERRREYGVVWIMYMRFARRAEGTKAGRDTFGKARLDKLAPWQVYEAAAQTEYHSGRDASIATRIFSKGLEIFNNEAEYVVRYLSFLLSINDEKNAGALFSEVSKTFPPDQARPIWERWARHQYQYGDLATALAIEKSMAEVYPKDYPIKRFAQRHIYDGTDAIAARDLGFAYARQQNQPQNQNHSQTQSQSQSQGHSQNRELGRSETGQSLKRGVSPERESGYKRRDRDEPGYKRGRGASPAGREPRRRYDSPHGSAGAGGAPGWNDRDGGSGPNRGNKWGAPPPAPPQPAEERVQVPNVLNWFVGALPPAASFDGPIFRTDDLMQVFRNAVIPSATGPPRIRSPPPPPRGQAGGGRPPPDYGPYQGPGGGRRGGRY
ncbi:Suf-domain-containing protein [Peniophora sp. CONT]|nr:Suf-domain-containing protein [Peniophora sp. CONT]